MPGTGLARVLQRSVPAAAPSLTCLSEKIGDALPKKEALLLLENDNHE